MNDEPQGLTLLPCALGYQECTSLLAADVLWWVGGMPFSFHLTIDLMIYFD